MPEIAQIQSRTVDRMMVRIEHLDKLLSLAGEVIIASSNLHDLQRNMQELVSRQATLTDEGLDVLKATNEAARRISQDLHDLVMDIRLVEIGETLRLLRRPIRDLARSLGREVEYRVEGAETMIDKALAERLVDPLLHLVRNAVDHGIEPPLERSRLDKPNAGKVTIRAIDREHHTEIEVVDDGRGVDPAAVRARARASGIAVDEEQTDLLDLLCTAGFSTRTDVTETSGRGVGLDLVRSVVDEFGGEIELRSALGVGTAFHLRIPKLRAVNIVDALTVRAGDRLFAFPIDQVVSSLGAKAEDVQTAMTGGRYLQYLGEVVVLHDLQQLLGDTPLEENALGLPVVIIESRAGRIGLVVSEFLGPQKLVNVPLDETVFQVEGVAGTSVFTGGRIGLTVDVDGLIDRALGAEAGLALKAPRLDVRAGGPTGSAKGSAHPGSSPPSTAEPTPPTSGESDRRRRAGDTVVLEKGDVADLLEELRRSLGDLQDSILSLESEPERVELMHQAFRRLHAVKGNFTMLEADQAADFAHAMETVLDYLRSERLPINAERVDLLLDGAAWLAEAADRLPEGRPAPPKELAARLAADVAALADRPDADGQGDLIGRTFALSPTVELQVLSAQKRGEKAYESYVEFHPGRQAGFLVAYLILRRLGMHGTVLASLPPVDEIEHGGCGNAFKVLWSTPLGEAEVADLFERLTPLYGLGACASTATTIFRYERAGSE